LIIAGLATGQYILTYFINNNNLRHFKNILSAASIVLCSSFIVSCNNEENKTTTVGPSDSNTTIDTSVHTRNAMQDTVTVAAATAIISGTYPDTLVNGSALFETTTNGKIKMILDITVLALANKTVAVHLHEHGDCGENGKASHGHWNPMNAPHGKWGSAAFHAGDIGNVKLNAKGKGVLTLTTDLWTLGGKADKNIVGRAVIVHSGVDDYTTQPTGNAGGRIACGVIRGQ
jgi:Cu-Zn family superoxide dismutase